MGRTSRLSAGERRAARLLFWSMMLVSGTALALCLLLPPWNEYRVARTNLLVAQANYDALDRADRRAQAELRHHQSDPEFVDHFFRTQSNTADEGVEVIPISLEAEQGNDAANERPQKPTLASRIDAIADNNPLTAIFTRRETRPFVMGMSAIMMITAIAFLPAVRDKASN